jgi:hypothetical protein
VVRSLIAVTVALTLAAPAAAATYSAKPAAKAPAKIAGREMLWSCSTDACTGNTAESRPLVLCQSLAKKAGRLESFAVDGRPFTAAELDRCNSAAKGSAAPALAAQ